MAWNGVQERVATLQREANISVDPASRLLDLASEVGEVAKELLLATDYGRKEFVPPAVWSAELADTLFSLVVLANATGVDLDRALDDAVVRYEQRLRSRGSIGSG